ncbi:MAG: hypothetical protein V7604_1586 [Hyphomicrobiales bacterium]|jgi:hypothetical protein
MGVLVKGPWRAPSLVKLVHERKRLDRLIEDTCTERIAALDEEKMAPVFRAPSADTLR